VPNPSSSYWQDDVPFTSLADMQFDALPTEVDVVIIGSGITAAVAATKALFEVSSELPRILVLEARQTCSGAMGRNGRHIKYTPYVVFPHLQRLQRAQAFFFRCNSSAFSFASLSISFSSTRQIFISR
jgi:hypothetical protein